jgi:DNA-binding transcriptional MerR regulator
MTTMKIGQVAEQTGLSIHTLRYYEQIGLVSPITREETGHRVYSEDDVYQIMFVIRLRSAGMPIADVKRYVELAQRGDETIVERLNLLEAHRAAVEQSIEELQEHLTTISNKIAHYRDLHKSALDESATARAALEMPS